MESVNLAKHRAIVAATYWGADAVAAHGRSAKPVLALAVGVLIRLVLGEEHVCVVDLVPGLVCDVARMGILSALGVDVIVCQVLAAE